jgi:hypothetical protein
VARTGTLHSIPLRSKAEYHQSQTTKGPCPHQFDTSLQDSGADLDAFAQELLKETEKLLETWKHPDPYINPTSPGGTGCIITRRCAWADMKNRIQIRKESPTAVLGPYVSTLTIACRLSPANIGTAPPPGIKF